MDQSAVIFGWPVMNWPPALLGNNEYGTLGDILLTQVANVPVPLLASETINFSAGSQNSPHCQTSWPYVSDESGWFPGKFSGSINGPGYATTLANTLVPIVIDLADVVDDVVLGFDYISQWAQSSLAVYDAAGRNQIASASGSTQRSTVSVTIPANHLSAGQNKFQLLVDPGMVYGLNIQADFATVPVAASYFWRSLENGENPSPMAQSYEYVETKGVASTDTETKQFAESLGIEVDINAGAIFEKVSAKLTASFTATQTYQSAIQLTSTVTKIHTFDAPSLSHDLTFVIWQLMFRFDAPNSSLATFQSESPLIIGRTYPDPPPSLGAAAEGVRFL